MRKHILVLSAIILFALNAFAQSPNYLAAMGKNLEQMRNGQTTEELQQVANTFERIAKAEKNEWLPLYYTALTYINISNKQNEGGKKDYYLDRAQEHLDKAFKLVPTESELMVLQGYIHLARIGVAPMERGMKYSGLALENFEKAKKQNPENPRAYFMLASTKYNTPEMFGGGPVAAKPYLDQAKEKYETFKAASAIAPNWGQQQVLTMLAQYK